MQRDTVCWQCGKPATNYLSYWRGGHGWVDLPVCDLKDGHPAFEEMEMARDNCIGLDNCATAGATTHPQYTTAVGR